MDMILLVKGKMKDLQHIHYCYINKEVQSDNLNNQYNLQEFTNMSHLNTDKFKEGIH